MQINLIIFTFSLPFTCILAVLPEVEEIENYFVENMGRKQR